jgi:hypothetical protein
VGRSFVYDLLIEDPDLDTWEVVLAQNTINAVLSSPPTSIIISPTSPSAITPILPHILHLTISDSQGATTEYLLAVSVSDNSAPQFVSQPEDITVECNQQR